MSKRRLSMAESDVMEEFGLVDQAVEKYLVEEKVSPHNNVFRRKLYSRIELFRLDVEDVNDKLGQNATCDDILTKLTTLSKKVPLVPEIRPSSLFLQIETAIRFLGVTGMFILSGTFLCFPILFLRAIDIAIQNDPFNFQSEKLKRWTLHTFLHLSGVDLRVEGVQNEVFSSSTAVLTFTHASNLDGFLVAVTCPIRQLAFGKKELFVVPFFSWLSLAIGGVPVDRGHRDRAVGALRFSAAAALQSKLCVAIAPEGTRSLSGQLLPFKKGAFYLASDLDAPIVPLLIFGAADLYPVGRWVNNTGIITVRYLPPILHDSSMSKVQLIREVRRKVLLALADCPETVGQDISSSFKFTSMLANLLVIILNLLLFYVLYAVGVNHYGLSILQVVLVVFAAIIAVTALTYIYYVYIIHLLFPSPPVVSEGRGEKRD